MPDILETRTPLDRMIQRLVAAYAPQKVILFGSYAWGQPAADSDFDLLIVKETADRFLDRLWTVRQILAGERQEVPLEVLVLTPHELADRLVLGDQFLTEIVEKGKILYAA